VVTDPTPHNAPLCEQCGEDYDAFCPYADYDVHERPPLCENTTPPPDEPKWSDR
jgi:hypothetical protein